MTLTFAQKLKALRKAAGLTQQGMADQMLIPRRTIQDWERGLFDPPEYVQRFVLNELWEMKVDDIVTVDLEDCKDDIEKEDTEKEGVYLIYTDSMDDASTIVGYCLSKEEADKYCEDHKSEYYNELTWELLEKL